MALGRGGEFAVVFSLRVAVSLVAVLCMVLFSGVPLARAASDKVFPSITVATPGASGAQAIAALGGNLPAVADYYGMTAEQLRNQLLGDSGHVVEAVGDGTAAQRHGPSHPSFGRSAEGGSHAFGSGYICNVVEQPRCLAAWPNLPASQQARCAQDDLPELPGCNLVRG